MAVPTTAADISTSAASNSPAGTDAIGTSLDDYLRSIQAILKQENSAGVDIASGTSITVPSAGKYFTVTGTTTITGIADSWTGRTVYLHFSGILTFTHNATIVLPGAASITTAVGDVAIMTNESAGVWRCDGYMRASGLAVVPPSTIVGITGTIAQFNTAVTDADLAVLGANTFTGIQTITNIVLPTNGQVLHTVPTTDGHATGPTTSDFVSGYTSSAVGDLVYLDSSSKWQKTDANTAALYNGFLGIALAVAATDAALLVALPGSFVYATGFPALTVGSPVYMSETAGAITHTAPTTTDSATRVVGFAVTADVIYFNPSPTYWTHT